MISEHHQPYDLTARWARRSLPRRVIAQWLRQGAAPEDPQPRWFTDSATDPQVVMRLHGLDCWIHGPQPLVADALAALYAHRLDGDTPWPDTAVEAEWEKAGRRELRLGRSPLHSLNSARAIGWRDAPEEAQPNYCANPWYVTGKPRFAHLIKHDCRTVHGDELLEYMLAAEPTEHVNYRRACLEHGPSFVCEVGSPLVGTSNDQEPTSGLPTKTPVCSSFTHLGGPMGGIFTPPEHRGQGFGKSLTALQVDTMLELQGLAVASIRVDNVASYKMLQAVEGRHLRGPMCWSCVVW